MGLWRLIRAWWRLRQRKLDCEILWPSLVAAAHGDVRWAQNGMFMHAMTDVCWRDEMDEVEIYRVIVALTKAEFAGNKSPWKFPTPSKAP